MEAGRLRDRVTIEQPGTVRSASGAAAPAWSAFATVYAPIRPLTMRERVSGAQLAPEVDTEIEIRFLDGVTAGMRVVAGTEVYGIDGAVDPERKRARLVLRCVKGRPGE
jgi:SPP1 family predicted phage head-tail adaptor